MEAAISAKLQIGVLGPLEVRREGRPVPITGAKQCALLALLSSEVGRVVSADRIVDELWDDDVPEDPSNALQHHASRLRRALGDDCVLRRSSGYLLNLPPESIDAYRLERLTADGRAALRGGEVERATSTLNTALSLWRGQPYTEFAGQGWARVAAARLERIRLDAVEDRFDAALAAGLQADVITEIDAATREHPLRERLWGQLMVALYRCGRQADALEVYRNAKHLLEEEQGLDPGPQLQQLEAAILAQDPALSMDTTADRQSAAGPGEQVPPAKRLLTPLTSFIGRHEQLTEVAELVRSYRLVTLTGPPGVGKTRLAIEVARTVDREFPDSVWLVELATVTDPSAVSRSVAAALGVQEQGDQVTRTSVDDAAEDSALTGLVARLRPSPAILVLDNCEHLLSQVADLTEPLLQRCEHLRVLATSRQPLSVPGEVQWPVPPLSLPVEHVAADPRELAGSEAVRLFQDRARRIRPSFALTADSGPAVAQICRHLDGLPLAIELAAARVNALPLSHIEEALADRFTFLASRSRSAPARQQTLQATVDWSYASLREDERRIFLSVSVFVGGFSLSAAQWMGVRVGVRGDDIRDVVADLVEKSLLVPTAADRSEARYEMLETLRAYGTSKLGDTGRLTKMRQHHAEYFAELADAADQQLYGPESVAGFLRFDADFDNIRAAIQNSLREGNRALAVRLAGSVGWFCRTTARHREGRAWLEAALASVDDSVPALARARALTSLCNLAAGQLDLEAAVKAGEDGLRFAIDSGDGWQIAFASASLAAALRDARRPERVPTLLAAAQRGFESVSEPRGDWGMAGCALIAAIAAIDVGDLEAVERASVDLAQRARTVGHAPWRAWARLLDGWQAERRGDAKAAVRAYEEVLPVVQQSANSGPFTAFILTMLGRAAMAAGDPERAVDAMQTAVEATDASTAPWFAALAHYGLAQASERSGAVEAARSLYLQVIAESPAAGSDFSRDRTFSALAGSPAAGSLVALGALELRAEHPDEAGQLQRAGLERAYEEYDLATMVEALRGLADSAGSVGDADRAAVLHGAAEGLRDGGLSPELALERGSRA